MLYYYLFINRNIMRTNQLIRKRSTVMLIRSENIAKPPQPHVLRPFHPHPHWPLSRIRGVCTCIKTRTHTQIVHIYVNAFGGLRVHLGGVFAQTRVGHVIGGVRGARCSRFITRYFTCTETARSSCIPEEIYSTVHLYTYHCDNAPILVFFSVSPPAARKANYTQTTTNNRLRKVHPRGRQVFAT